jgi:hypothetical protein
MKQETTAQNEERFPTDFCSYRRINGGSRLAVPSHFSFLRVQLECILKSESVFIRSKLIFTEQVFNSKYIA